MIDSLVAQIEERLGWGSGSDWSNKDFEELNDLIFDGTKKRLSVTTLKRIWGRAELVANPSSATLDILSEYIGYKNWREFVGNSPSKATLTSVGGKIKTFQLPTLILVLMGIAVLATIFGAVTTRKNVDASEFKFKSRPVSDEIPNSVVFEYDASAADDLAKIEIQQSWDKTKRVAINRLDSVATSIYYRPGFFKSKLVVDGTIVKENDVFIQTKDWLGLIERDSLPIYLKKEEIHQGQQLSITPEVLAQYGIDLKTTSVGFSLYLVKDFGEIYTDDFELSMEVKNTLEQGLNGCQEVQLYVLYDGGAIGIPLAKKGCSSNLNVLAFDETISGKKNDFSDFGVDFANFVDLELVSKEDTLEVLINGKGVHQMAVPETPFKIKGITLHFEGSGAIQNVELKSSASVFYTSSADTL
ncbi:hypothetical protein [Muricauda sp. MAR_2010_75]|uniref:hypothetical protein n=1 Tax=Allomuricauda sp. MAR_2010_75 TaxID=1250232 RepID=UPI000565FF8F|nr:hypothetical protein [Muricauda sp. MAR_2010_75]